MVVFGEHGRELISSEIVLWFLKIVCQDDESALVIGLFMNKTHVTIFLKLFLIFGSYSSKTREQSMQSNTS